MTRLAFLGSPEAAAVSLVALVEAGHDIAMVITRPDKRRGRGASLSPSPVKKAALDAGLAMSDKLDDVAASGAELGVVVAYGRLIPGRVLDATPMINAHFSLLPRWRGAAPVERAILAGDEETGVCIMRLEEGLDTGPVLVSREVKIRDDRREHASALTERLAVVASQLLLDLLRGGVFGLGPGEPQSGEPTYAAKIEADELRLDFTRPVTLLERLVRLDRAWTTFRGQRLIVRDAQALSNEEAGTGSGAVEPGTLEGVDVHAGDGVLRLLEVQPSGKRPLTAADWARGVRAVPGELLGT